MTRQRSRTIIGQITEKGLGLGLAGLGILLLMAVLLWAASGSLPVAHADPIEPPEGYPKLNLSVKTVTPTLAHTGGVTLYYTIEIINTGAYTATGTVLSDTIPADTTYNDDAQASTPSPPTFDNGTLTWQGDVGFDASVVVSFSVTVSPGLVGPVVNSAVITHPLIAQPITVTAEAIITDDPILTLEKSALPLKPGANKPLFYTLVVANRGQPAINVPITVTDKVPLSTTLRSTGPDGLPSPAGDVVTWTRNVNLDLGDTTVFTFSVNVGDVPSGTVIVNEQYQVTSPEAGVTAGEPFSVTIVDPIFFLHKDVWPHPPGSNREMTFTLTLLNMGSLATQLVITDRVPADVEYRRGGSYADGVVSWNLPSLDTGESAQFTFTVYIGDVMGVVVLNEDYEVCCAEGVCQAGEPLTSVVDGPNFETSAFLDPIAKKPGGGSAKKPVTPTLTVHNLGPGNAIDAQATLFFGNMSVQLGDLTREPLVGTLSNGPDCTDVWSKCVAFLWVGDLWVGDIITFTTPEGQSTIGGSEGNPYTATIVVTDTLGMSTTEPVSATAVGKVTHYANVMPNKTAPPVVGPGELLTYTIDAFNRGLSTELPPILTDVVPMSTTFVWASDGGISLTMSDTVIVSWTLPQLGPGEGVYRSFSVLVDSDAVSGTEIVNSDYSVVGYGNIVTDAVTSGPPVTTTVKEVGLIDSFKEVTPTLLSPGVGNVLTYSVHIVNSSPVNLAGVTVYDLMPWQFSTYQRDAVATAGQVISDIISFHWTGSVAGFSSQIVTFTVLVDPDFQGAITNTAVISHPSLAKPVEVEAVAYVTDRPELRISKTAKPDPVAVGGELAYTIRVANRGQQATSLVITDVIPVNTDYVADSASGGGKLVGDQVRWEFPVLKSLESRTFAFRVAVNGGDQVVNDRYAVLCAEGVSASGAPVITRIARKGGQTYLPLVLRDAP
jgi:uncharacterized repeat protein (TIGR01451 family)